MAKKGDSNNGAAKWGYLLKPAKDMTENFSFDLLSCLNDYLNTIRNKEDDEDEMDHDARENFKLFNFAEACAVLQGSTLIYGKKVDYFYDQVSGLVNIIESKGGEENPEGVKKTRRRKVEIGTAKYEIKDVEAIRAEAVGNPEKVRKDEKKMVDNFRVVDNTELQESHYERNCVRPVKPGQFMFGRNFSQFMRIDEQVYNSHTRSEVIGKVREFDLKKSDVLHDKQIVVTHDEYVSDIDSFTLPGARWVPDNQQLASHFGVADIEVELELEKRENEVNAIGPFKDPLSGREIIAPPKWFIEKEAARQQEAMKSRPTTKTSCRDSQGVRLSRPLIECNRDNAITSFVENQLNRNRPSTRLNTGAIDMIVDKFGEEMEVDENGMCCDEIEMDFEGAGGVEDADGSDVNEFENETRMSRAKKKISPWDDIERTDYRKILYNGDEKVKKINKAIKLIEKEPHTSSYLLERKLKNDKTEISRKDQFLRTNEYLQKHFYWRVAAQVNPDEDWMMEALRVGLLKEKKRRAKKRTEMVRTIRAQRKKPAERDELLVDTGSNEKQSLNGAEIPLDDAVVSQEPGSCVPGPEASIMEPPNNGPRRTIGVEYEEVIDDELRGAVEDSIMGDRFEDVVASIDDGGSEGNVQCARFEDFNDAELGYIINLPGEMFINKADAILRSYAQRNNPKDKMAYEMAKAYENVDLGSTELQKQVDDWQALLDPILEESETRKEYNVHEYSKSVLEEFSNEGQRKTFVDLCVGKPWFEISRLFLSCLLMANTKNVQISEDDENVEELNDRINKMNVSLLSKKMHNEVFASEGVFE